MIVAPRHPPMPVLANVRRSLLLLLSFRLRPQPATKTSDGDYRRPPHRTEPAQQPAFTGRAGPDTDLSTLV
jgi:hypothetical protein